jgi:hypothetical protein
MTRDKDNEAHKFVLDCMAIEIRLGMWAAQRSMDGATVEQMKDELRAMVTASGRK